MNRQEQQKPKQIVWLEIVGMNGTSYRFEKDDPEVEFIDLIPGLFRVKYSDERIQCFVHDNLQEYTMLLEDMPEPGSGLIVPKNA